MVVLEGQGATLVTRATMWLLALALRSLCLAPVLMVVAIQLFVLALAVMLLIDTSGNSEAVMGIVAGMIPDAWRDVQFSVSGAEAEQFLLGHYLRLSLWISVALELLSVFVRRRIVISEQTKLRAFLMLTGLGTLTFAVVVTNGWPLAERLIGSGIYALVSLLYGGIPLLFLLGFTALGRLMTHTVESVTLSQKQ